jgi:hypothetical protein
VSRGKVEPSSGRPPNASPSTRRRTRRQQWSTPHSGSIGQALSLFRIGFLESNPRFTISGLPFDRPVSYAEGKRTIVRDTAALFGKSLANNAACAIVERLLIARAPRHRKLIRTLGWIERISFAAYYSHRLSVRHFEQWRANERLARQLGAR